MTNLHKMQIASVLLLGGCATPGAAPVRDRIVEISKPVAIQPIKPSDRPTPPAPLGPRPPALRAQADILLGKWCEAVAYIIKSEPLLAISAGMPPLAAQAYPECEISTK